MKRTALILAAIFLTACAAQEPAKETSTQDAAQAIRDFIDVRELEEVDRLSTSHADRWEQLDQSFLLYKGRRATHLVEFARRCWELDDNSRIVADERRSGSHIYARFDTIRGCRIDKLYALTEHEIAELENIGEAVGSRN
jgi:glycine/D-amino acid oxidase-like deaminating enzyme